MGKRVRTETAGKLELKMTSMVDVVFLLLIFFMVTLSVPRPEGMLIAKRGAAPEPPPVPGPGIPPPRPEDLSLRIKMENGVVRRYINSLPMNSDDRMLSYLRQCRKADESGRAVLFCDDGVPYGELVRVMDVAQLARIRVAFGDL